MKIPSKSNQPLVSILICNYNYGRFIAQAINSALAQRYPNVEIIVVDDGSTDNSREVIDRYGSRVKAVYKTNGGQSSAFNAAFYACSGEIICLLDSDDYFAAEKVARIVECYRQNPGAYFVLHCVQRVNNDGNIFGEPARMEGSRWLDYRHKANKFTAPPTSGLTFLRAPFARMFPLPESLRILTDNYIKFVMLALYPGFYLAEPLAALRLHGNNAYSMGPSDEYRAQTSVQIATAMRNHFPGLVAKSDRLVSIAMAKNWKLKFREPLTGAKFAGYLRGASLLSKLRIYLGSGIRYCKHAFLPPKSAPNLTPSPRKFASGPVSAAANSKS